jgi:putative endonuclease
MLVYYESHNTYLEAAGREARCKYWCRKVEAQFHEEFNRDLFEEIGT